MLHMGAFSCVCFCKALHWDNEPGGQSVSAFEKNICSERIVPCRRPARAVQIGRYLVQSGATVRAAAQVFGVSKSTVWKDQCRLQHLAPGLWQEVRAVLLYNKAQRHLRGGEATRCKYLHAQHNHAD